LRRHHRTYTEKDFVIVCRTCHTKAAQSGWLLGRRLEEEKELRDLWHRDYALSFKEAQNLFAELLERVGQKKRPEARGSRVNRLKGLGNAIVPQIAEYIGKRFMNVA
jgi:hypothetical protein